MTITIIICPGIHDPELTQQFLASLGEFSRRTLVLPTQQYPPYSGKHVLDFLQQALLSNRMLARSHRQVPDDHSRCDRASLTASTPQFPHLPVMASQHPRPSTLIFISFSAGVVGAIHAARTWQQQHGTVGAFIAVDGWGVPLIETFPCYRLSHDYFTHWSSQILGRGAESFYADPPIPHLQLWSAPETATGWYAQGRGLGMESSTRTTAAKVLQRLLRRHLRNET